MFLLVPAYPGCPGQTAVIWLLLLLLLNIQTAAAYTYGMNPYNTKAEVCRRC